MTVTARNRAWRIPESARVAALLAGTAGESGADFWSWFDPAYRASPGCDILGAALEAWARVVNGADVLAWWESDRGGKIALPSALLRRGLAGAARIAPAEAGWFTFARAEAPAGEAVVTWLAGGPAEGLDLLAMDPAAPARWWHLTACAEVLPGRRALSDLAPGQAIRLFEYPLAWLAAGCPDGAFCVLHWARPEAQALLADIEAGRFTVVCDSDDHVGRLQALARPRREPLRLRVAMEAAGPGAG